MVEIPFREGQVVECRSFLEGYRGAWFRCKILEIVRGDTCRLQYLDYQDKPYYTKLYQYVPKTKRKEKQIMVRPEFPSVVRHYNPATSRSLVAVVTREWEVGDFVDWFSRGCYWECQIVEVLSKRRVKVVCPDPPFGQGGTYDRISTKLLRPALAWCPELGWRVKLPKAVPCVSLINAQPAHSQSIQGSDAVAELPEDPEPDSSVCDDPPESSQSTEGCGDPLDAMTSGSDQRSASAVSDSVSQPRRKGTRRLKLDCSDDEEETGSFQSQPSAHLPFLDNDFRTPVEIKSQHSLKPSSSILGDENQMAQVEDKMFDGFVAAPVDREVKYRVSRKIVRQAKLYLLAKEAQRLDHTRKKNLHVAADQSEEKNEKIDSTAKTNNAPVEESRKKNLLVAADLGGEKNEKMDSATRTNTPPLEERNGELGHERVKSADSDKSCEIVGATLGFEDATTQGSDKSCEIFGGAPLGHDEEVACTNGLEDEDCVDLTLVLAVEELTERVLFLKDVLKHGVKECLQRRSQSKWEIKQALLK